MISAVKEWLKKKSIKSELKVRKTSIDECTGWTINKRGHLEHQSGHFFKIKGLQIHSNNPSWNQYQLPAIEQSEIGILAFLVRNNEGKIEWCIQAKTEPGIINGTQIAPTIQATRSNYTKRHNGKSVPYVEFLTEPNKCIKSSLISDSYHSEQGTKFLWKFNRNAVLVIDNHYNLKPAHGIYKWISSETLRQLLSESNIINTDSRSVLSTTNWGLLNNSFSLFSSDSMLESYRAHSELKKCQELLIKSESCLKIKWQIMSLYQLKEWEIEKNQIYRNDSTEFISFYNISLTDREVSSWCQPLIGQHDEVECILYMRFHKNTLQFFVKATREFGFGNRSEFGPSIYPADLDYKELISQHQELQSKEMIFIQQTDEGSRFDKIKVRYSIHLTENPPKALMLAHGIWVNLKTIDELTSTPGTTNNELRTLTSLILSNKFDDEVSQLS